MIVFRYRHQSCAFTSPNTQDTVCFNGSHLFYHIITSTIRMLDPQNISIDTKIMPLSYLGPEIMLKTCSEWRPYWNPRWRPKTQITAWQTTYHGSGRPNEYFDTICQLLPKMFSGTFILSFCPLTTTLVLLLGVSLVGLLIGRGSVHLSGVPFVSMVCACDNDDDTVL